MSGAATAEGPDFSVGIAIADVPPGGTLAGRVGEHPVLLSRLGGELFAVTGDAAEPALRGANGEFRFDNHMVKI